MIELTSDTPVEEIVAAIQSHPPGAWPDGWHTWANVQRAYRQLLRSHRQPEPPPGVGRGIVTVGGGSKYYPGVWVLVRRLRQLGCTLPIEVWHLGPEEVDPYMASLLAPYDAVCVDAHACAVEHDAPCRIWGGWQLKAYSVYHSRFRELVFIDADNVPTRDPSYLFELAAYQDTGAIFWPDFPTWTWRPQQWALVGLPANPSGACPREQVAYWYSRDMPDDYLPAIESGQFVVDRQRCATELAIALGMCEHSDYWFRHYHGDKDMFFAAWQLTGRTYAMPRIFPGWVGDYCCLQFAFDGALLFEHRNHDKWSLAGNRSCGLPGERECLDLVVELASVWRGKVWDWPVDMDDEHVRGLLSKSWLYRRRGLDQRQLELQPDGRIGHGAAAHERRWALWTRGQPTLALCGEDQVTCLLAPAEHDSWRGRWLRYEQCEVELVPA
jgi:hypothetical protein